MSAISCIRVLQCHAAILTSGGAVQGHCQENCSSRPQCAPWSSAYTNLNDNCAPSVAVQVTLRDQDFPCLSLRHRGPARSSSAWHQTCHQTWARNRTSILSCVTSGRLITYSETLAPIVFILPGASAWLLMKVLIWLRAWHVIRIQCLLSFSLLYEYLRRTSFILITDPRSIFVSSLGAMVTKLSFHLYRIDASHI